MKFAISILLLVAASAISTSDIRRLALQNPNLFEGDILGFDPEDRNVSPSTQRRWSNRTVPYVIDSSLASNQSLILSAMNDFHNNTCLRFVPRTTEKNYLKFISGQGCYSYFGMVNLGKQEVSLGAGCLFRGTIVHELGHAIGFFHEQNRSDRDQHLTIYWQNIHQGMENNFAIQKGNLLLAEFDLDSIMISGNYAFSRDHTSITMEAKNGRLLLDPYHKQGLTAIDIEKVNKLYCQAN